MSTIAVGITHAAFDEERRSSVLRLKARLRAMGIEPVVEEDRVREGNLRPWMRTLRRLLTETNAYYLVMLPDDALVRASFSERLNRACERFQGRVMCLYPNHPKAGKLSAYEAYETPDGFAGFAVFPRDKAEAFLAWRGKALRSPEEDTRRGGTNSDEQVALWLMNRRELCLKPLPGLVDHDSSLPSLEGHDTDSFRQAVSVELGKDARGIYPSPLRTYEDLTSKLVTHLVKPDIEGKYWAEGMSS